MDQLNSDNKSGTMKRRAHEAHVTLKVPGGAL